MKLVVDNDTKIATLPIGNLNLGEMLRKLADQIDAGEYGEVYTVVSLLIREDGMTVCSNGEQISSYELMGIFEAAKLRVFADDVIED